jgi:hypothetical protein
LWKNPRMEEEREKEHCFVKRREDMECHVQLSKQTILAFWNIKYV